MTYHLVRKSAYVDHKILVDVCFPTKLNRPLLASPDARALVEQRLRFVAKTHGAAIIHLELADDHARMRLSVPPQLSPLGLVTALKNDTARALKANFPELGRKVSSIWSWQVYLRSVGSSQASAIDDYLRSTRGLHHAQA